MLEIGKILVDFIRAAITKIVHGSQIYLIRAGQIFLIKSYETIEYACFISYMQKKA